MPGPAEAPPSNGDDVLVTAVVAYGESDCVVRMFSRTRGRVGGFARKARASKRRFPGLSAPCLGKASMRERHGADLLELTELDVDPALLGLAADLRGLGHAAYVAELVERLLPEAEPAPEIFDLVTTALRRIAREGPSAVLLRALELKLLLFLGYLPDLFDPHETAASGAELPDDARLAAIALVQAESLDALPEVDMGLLRPLSRIFAVHLRRQGGGPLKSVQFLASLDVSAERASLAGPDRSR